MADAVQLQKPFLKWAGSKKRMVNIIKPLLPFGQQRLIEPFVGSGAVFINTEYPANLLCDSNRDLICVYQALQQEEGAYIQECQSLFTSENNTEKRFYELREEFNQGADPRKRAALFIYLNRHCYNGLCRYNQAGKFNTPFGRYDRPYFPAAEMQRFAARLKSAELRAQDFRATLAAAREGDVVYCDPPYVPLSATANFTDYASGGFSETDQKDLMTCALEAVERGAVVAISNHDTPFTRELYRGSEQLVFASVSRSISCDGQNRKKAGELVAVFTAKSAGYATPGARPSPGAASLKPAIQQTQYPSCLDNALD